MPEYLIHNASMKLETGLIFQLRSGSNFTNQCKNIRHLSSVESCLFCPCKTESVYHVLVECKKYKYQRDKLKSELKNLMGEITAEHELYNIILSNLLLELLV